MSSDETTENSGASDDVKRKFREALEKKNNSQRKGEAREGAAPRRDGATRQRAAAGKAKLSKEFSATRNHWYSSLR